MSVHVTKHSSGKWQVITAGSKKAYRIVDTQAEAIKIADELSKNKGVSKRVHGTNGKIRKTKFEAIEKSDKDKRKEEKLKKKLAKEKAKEQKLKEKLKKLKEKEKKKALKKQKVKK